MSNLLTFSKPESILDQLEVNKAEPGIANFARIPVTKFDMREKSGFIEDLVHDQAQPNQGPPHPELVTFAPNAVTVSAVNNEGSTRLLEVVRIPGFIEPEPEHERVERPRGTSTQRTIPTTTRTTTSTTTSATERPTTTTALESPKPTPEGS